MASSLSAAPGRLREHTLVVPTYNRPKLLERLVRYYRTATPDLNVLVLDSSHAEAAAQNAATVAAVGGSVRYRAFPSTTPMASKLDQGLAEVPTPTASFCADDDLVFPAGLVEAIDFLSDAPTFVSAHGLYINFGEHGHRIQVMREYAGPSNEADHPGARIFRLCQNYESIFYGVFRTGDLQDVFRAVAAIPTLHFQELFQSCAVLLKGKVKRLPHLYAARRSGPAAEPDRDKWQTYYWFADHPTEMVEHFAAYRDQLWRFHEQHGQPSNLDRAAFEKVIDITHAIYFAKGCPPAYFHSVLQPLWPGDAFVKPGDDLFRAMAPPDGVRRFSPAERFAFRVLRWLLRMRPKPRKAPAASAEGGAPSRNLPSTDSRWTLDLAPDLRWLAANADFQMSFRALCAYLDAAPA